MQLLAIPPSLDWRYSGFAWCSTVDVLGGLGGGVDIAALLKSGGCCE